MHWIDLLIFVVYLLLMLGVGVYFLRKNESEEDYYVGGRSIGPWHIGLSVVATDVGGGFSIGLGGLGFAIGLSGSWMLFTGLIGAYASAIFLIPRVKGLSDLQRFTTFPQLFGHFFNSRTALLAGIISGIGYIGFTASQMLAGAKMAAATFPTLSLDSALLIMGLIIVVYTMMGGLKAVIFTDTIQWIILIAGLIFVGIPIAWVSVGGWEAIQATLPGEFFAFDNLRWQDLANWFITIVPIWFVGMTLYQRIYASRSEKEARQAWMIAGWFEWPIMAMMGVTLGLLARVAAEQGAFSYLGYASAEGMDVEMGLPFLLRTVLPVGMMGLMMAAYFSAIMSTADSCLMAASGNVVTDILGRVFPRFKNSFSSLRMSQGTTLLIGALAVLLALGLENVLELMLYSYAFMVSGLFVPILGALYGRKRSSQGAFWAMLVGGGTTLTLSLLQLPLPLELDANLFGLLTAALIYFTLTHFLPDNLQEN